MKNKKRAVPRRIPEILSPQEQQALVNEMAFNGPFRNYLMMRLMLNCGLRLSEVINLQVRDVDWESRRFVVKLGKGAKDRALWLSEEDCRLLQTYVEEQGVVKHIFLSRDGKPLSSRYVRAMLGAAGQRAGLKKHLYPHLLRHTFGSDLLRQTKNIRLVAKAMGHSHISTTMIYTHIVDEELEQAMGDLHNGG